MNGCAAGGGANETSGIVTRVEGGHAWVAVEHRKCGHCTGERACGSGLLGLRATAREYRLINTIGAAVGDEVTITVAGGQVLKGALLAYAMPLGLGISGAAAGLAIGGTDWMAACGLLAGIAGGWALLRWLPMRREPAAGIALKRLAQSEPYLSH